MQLIDIAIDNGWIAHADRARYVSFEEATLYIHLLEHFHIDESHLISTLSTFHPHLFLKNTLQTLFSDESATLCHDHCYLLYTHNDAIGYVVDNPYVAVPQSDKRLAQQRYWVSRSLFKTLIQTGDELPKTVRQTDSGCPKPITDLLSIAQAKEASDIHFFAQLDGCRCDFRVHGQLYTIRTYTQPEWKKLLSLFKFYGHMDISVHLMPQDGRLMSSNISCRLSTLPSLHGEDLVIRLTDPQKPLNQLSDLGLCSHTLSAMTDMSQLNAGLVLVTGPTGSGKTTTLYGLIQSILHSQKKVIVTLEDPIERDIPAVRQSQINRISGFGFAEGLRAILRQDPDVIMIGEIRDKETAQIAVEAAYTGHLVLSSLHTATIRDSLLRLLSFGVDPFLISHSLRGILSQRLERITCGSCAGQGCASCEQAGMIGRQAYHACFRPQKSDSILALDAIDSYLDQGEYWTFKMDKDAKDRHGN